MLSLNVGAIMMLVYGGLIYCLWKAMKGMLKEEK
jgi:hypothetical protein